MVTELLTSAFTCFDKNMEDPVSYNVDFGDVVIFSSRAPGKETANEDALAIIPVNETSIVFAVADGLGGLPAGEMASRIVIEELKKSLKRASSGEIHLRGAILDGIEKANKKILEQKPGSATTLIVTELQGKNLRSYHAGDSMILLMSNRGKIKYSTIPHSPTGYALESGMMNEAEAMQHEERHLISNCIGSQDMRLEIGPMIELSARDTLLLASDGLSDNMYEKEIIEASRKGPLIDCARVLTELARDHMLKPKEDRTCHPDDLSYIMFRINS